MTCASLALIPVVFVPFAGNGLKFVKKCGNLAFVVIEMNAGQFVELVD